MRKRFHEFKNKNRNIMFKILKNKFFKMKLNLI